MELNWEDGFSIAVDIQDNAVVVRANRQGLLSLAGHLVTLAQDSTAGAHLHLDQYNSLEECSAQLIIEKINN
ncbi:MAG: hypothetical protein IJ925_05450 [Muribaculaceae bacterium]|nr:hypothetical protein [Muribaculaceae bacterium]